MKHHPYHITHIDLSKERFVPELNSSGEGNYVVYWFKSIALGHAFFDPGVSLSETEHHVRLIEAVAPTLEFYKNKSKPGQPGWQQFISKENYDQWLSWASSVIALWEPDSIPPMVPVSVIICTHNRALLLQKCIATLKRLECQPAEIIVVDNAPKDDATLKVVQQFNDVVYVNEPRIGLDIARNTGVKRASLPVVAFVDDDVLIHKRWLYNVWDTFRNPAITAMTGLVLASELETEAQYIFEKYWSFNRGFKDIIYDSTFYQNTLHKGPPVWHIGAGANMAFRQSVFEEVGLFDERLDAGAAGCSGDSEMWYRIIAAGHTIQYNPRAIVHHEHRKELKGLKKQLFNYMRGFATAALLQQRQNRRAGYIRHLFWVLPRYYARLLRSGFPKYTNRHKTLTIEMMGVLSGLVFYHRNKTSARFNGNR